MLYSYAEDLVSFVFILSGILLVLHFSWYDKTVMLCCSDLCAFFIMLLCNVRSCTGATNKLLLGFRLDSSVLCDL